MKKTFILLAFMFVMSIGTTLSAQSPTWSTYPLPDGSPVLKLRAHGNHLAALGMRGLWTSSNNGNNWVKVSAPFKDDGYSGVDFDENGNVYITANEFNSWLVMKTSNQGLSWQTIDSTPNARAMDICLLDGKIISVGGKGTGTTGYTGLVHSSSNQGTTWQSDSLGPVCALEITVHPATNIAYVRTEAGLWKLGSTWNFVPVNDLTSSSFAISRGSEITVIGRKATSPHDKRIHSSSNGGFSWFNQETGYGDEGSFNAVAYTDDGIALVAGDDIGAQGRYGTLLMKKKSTAAWESIFPATEMTFFNALATNSEYIFIGTQNGKILRGNKNITSVHTASEVSTSFSLNQNYPNPFNPTTKINFTIPRNSFVDLRVYDIVGKEVAILVNEVKGAGSYSIAFDGSNLSSGVYLYILRTDEYTETKKMILQK